MQPEPSFQPHEPLPNVNEQFQLGMKHIQQGDFASARWVAEAIRAAAPQVPLTFVLLANIHAAEGDPDAGLAQVQAGLDVQGDAPLLLEAGARLSVLRGAAEDALDFVERIPEAAAVWRRSRVWRERALVQLGRLDEAASNLESLDPRMPPETILLAQIREQQGDADAARSQLTSLLDTPGLKKRFEARAAFELSRLCDALGEHDAAFAAATRGNQRIARGFNAAGWTTQADGIVSNWSEELMASAPRSECVGSEPIFIIGLPESGRTLVEQVIGQHPEVVALGEYPGIRTALETTFQQIDGGMAPEQLTEQVITRTANDVGALLETSDAAGSRMVCRPQGIEHLAGLLPLCVPSCRIVFVRRTPLDNLLSIYLRFYRSMTLPYSTGLDELVTARQCHDRLVDHWMQVLPCPCLDVSTEALIADPEGQVGALLEFLDLSWDAGCFAPLGEHASDGADSEQESSAVSALQEGRWRNYEAHIGPLLSAFGSA